MLNRKHTRVIEVKDIEHDDLIKAIESLDGVSVKRTASGVRISIHKSTLAKSSVGVCVKKKNKKGKKIEHLTPICGMHETKNTSSGFRQSSAIIAKTV